MDAIGQEPKGRKAKDKDPPMGPPRPFEEVYPEIMSGVRKVARQMVGPEMARAMANDVAHDLALRMWELYRDAAGVFRPPVKTGGYIRRSARNRLADFLEARNTRRPRERAWEETRGASVRDWMDPERSARTALVDEDYARTLHGLRDETRAIYLRVHEDDLTHSEVAHERGITVRRVKYHVMLAEQALGVLETKYGRED
jgi:RNA polymerase sigma factor (sigma-70 family)